MSFLGRTPSNAPLTSADIPDGIIVAADLAPDSVGTSEIADSVTLVTPNLGTPSAGVVTNLSGVLPVGVTGGSGLTALASNPTVTLGSNATFPAMHVIHRDYLEFTSTGAGSDPDTSWTDTSLAITVSEAQRASLSAIWVGVTNGCNIVPSTHTYVEFRIVRQSAVADVELAHIVCGHDGSWWTKANVSIQAQDVSLTSGYHVYKYQYRSTHSGHSGIIYYHGSNVSKCTMSLFGFK